MRRNKSVKLYIIIVLVLIIGFMAAGVKIFADRISENSEAGEAAVNIKEIQKIDRLLSEQSFRPDPVKAALGKYDGNASLTTPEFQKAPDGYFEDALFIGDSRTVGLKEYGNISGADFFATEGMSVYGIYKENVNIENFGAISFKTLIQSKKYGKIYIMLGINELGYRLSDTAARFEKLVNTIRKYQPDAIIYIEANLHVSSKLSNSDKIFNNSRIDRYNNMLAQIADNRTVFYIDANEMFDDREGGLGEEYTSDSIHIMGKYYSDWGSWIAERVIVK